MRLRKVLKNHLLLAGKQQKDFAEEIGWPNSSLSRFLNGKSVSQEHLAKLICWLLTEETP
jgi:transcriptional regulator with XRE-family HTH domain